MEWCPWCEFVLWSQMELRVRPITKPSYSLMSWKPYDPVLSIYYLCSSGYPEECIRSTIDPESGIECRLGVKPIYSQVEEIIDFQFLPFPHGRGWKLFFLPMVALLMISEYSTPRLRWEGWELYRHYVYTKSECSVVWLLWTKSRCYDSQFHRAHTERKVESFLPIHEFVNACQSSPAVQIVEFPIM